VLRRIGRAVTGRRSAAIRPEIVVCHGEILDAGTRAVLRDAFGSDPIGAYGMTELGYIGWQCEKRRAFHVNAEFFAVEVLCDGVAAAPGTLGNVVITALRSRTMPLLRYDTGDLSVAGAQPCDCACTLPTLNPIEGRANRTIRLPDGRRVTTRAIVDGLGTYLTPDDFRVAEDPARVFRLRLTRSAASRDVARAVGQLRALLEVPDLRIEVGDWPNDGLKSEVLPIARS
jgi:phenylacetate-coenzyme A ligase PaaK-like adenylate-forming protein